MRAIALAILLSVDEVARHVRGARVSDAAPGEQLFIVLLWILLAVCLIGGW